MRRSGPGELAEVGRREQQELGRRVAQRHPRLFHHKTRRPLRMAFYSSSWSRAVGSKTAFEAGLTLELNRHV